MDSRAEDKLQSLPVSPGCYLFIGRAGEILYVGKAKVLRSRVRSYFQQAGSDDRYFIPLLRELVADIDTVVTASEKEAAVLENELIKKHRPRFNVKLRDDKDFLCLRLDPSKPWPRLETVRRPDPDGARYFGPYHSATSARRTLHLVNKHFHLRTCSDADFASRKRPCLQFQIKRCPAPCVYQVDADAYRAQVSAVALFLEGRHDELSRELEQWMADASRELEFEKAAIYRDQLRAVESIKERQRIVSLSDVDQDVIGLFREGANVEIEVLFVRSGRVTDTVSYSLRKVELPDEEVLANFIAEFYGSEEDRGPIPTEILLPALPDLAGGVAEWLSEKRGRKVELVVPRRGDRKKLLDLAFENAKNSYQSKRRAAEDVEARLAELRDRLRLPSLPHRIECCDISHLGGGDTVGSIVALLDGQLDKKRYRTFHVKGASGGDDYAAMYEVLLRRFRRGKAAREQELAADAAPPEDGGPAPPDWDLPDLFVVDGGRGQLSVALAAARDLGLHDLTIVALAKERENSAGDKLVDRIYLPGQKNGIPLKGSSSALFFLARARDEAHRFANQGRKKLGASRRIRSELDDVRGLGEKTRVALLKTLGSVEAVRVASEAEILAVPGVNKRHLAAIREWRESSTPRDSLPRMRPVWRIGTLRIVGLLAMLAILAAGGVATSYVLKPEPPPVAARDVPTPLLRVAGHDLPTDGDAVGNALDIVRRYAIGAIKLRVPDGRVFEVNRADFGLEIDRKRLADFVTAALAPGSPLARAHAASDRAAERVEVPLPITVDGERALSKLVDLKARIDTASQSAVIDLGARTVKSEQVGYRLDVYGTLARLESAFRRGETVVDAEGEQVVPSRTASQLENVRFDAVLGFFETRYNTAKKFVDRSYNLQLAASRLDGFVLMPGETFDFNAVVGPRDEAHGYKVAPVIAQGEVVDGIGGGTCQISGTLHAAALFAGLEIVERYPHSRPSSYIKLGLDATVSYPNITYRFRNPFDYPVVLHEKVAGGVVRAEILGPERKLTVSYFRRIDQILPFEEVERDSEKLPRGERVVVQRGVPGFVATASRLVRDGAYGERTRWQEKYPPTTQIVAVGAGPEDIKPGLSQDAHPEYVVDEYLVMTQGPSSQTAAEPGGVTSERPVPGRTGTAGSIRALGLEKTPLEEVDKDKDDKDKDKDKDDKDKKKPKKDDPKKADPKKADPKKADPKKADPKSKKKKEAKT